MNEDMLLLLKSFDGNLNADEKQRLENALARSPELAREKAAMEAMRGDLASARTNSFSYGFAARVAEAAAGRSRQMERQSEMFENMKSAFFGTAVACATACLALFLWIRHIPNTPSYPSVKTQSAQSVEDAVQNATYQAVEEIL